MRSMSVGVLLICLGTAAHASPPDEDGEDAPRKLAVWVQPLRTLLRLSGHGYYLSGGATFRLAEQLYSVELSALRQATRGFQAPDNYFPPYTVLTLGAGWQVPMGAATPLDGLYLEPKLQVYYAHLSPYLGWFGASRGWRWEEARSDWGISGGLDVGYHFTFGQLQITPLFGISVGRRVGGESGDGYVGNQYGLDVVDRLALSVNINLLRLSIVY